MIVVVLIVMHEMGDIENPDTFICGSTGTIYAILVRTFCYNPQNLISVFIYMLDK